MDHEVGVKVRLLFARCLWMDYCAVTGTSDWAVNEGQLDMEDVVWMSEATAASIGLLR